MNKPTIQILKEIQNIPSVPFNITHVTKYITTTLEQNSIPYTQNPYAIIVKSKNFNQTSPKKLFMAHIDHPGIALKNAKEGKFFGLKSPQALNKILSNSPVTIKIFDTSGNYRGLGKLLKITDNIKQTVQIQTDLPIESNFSAQFELPYFSETSDTVSVYNADDGAAFASLLSATLETYESAQNSIFCFIKHEEVHQLSSWNLASTNFFKLTPQDFVFNLECLKCDPIDPVNYPCDYDNGLVLQLCNTGCLFGSSIPGDNFAESLCRQVSQKANINLQTGVIKDSCDSRPFSHFALTPNIVTLTIPNKNKHNGADDGNIVAETILKKDLDDLTTMVCELSRETQVTYSGENISLKLKENDFITDRDLLKRKAKLNRRLAVSMWPVVSRGYYFPKTFIDGILDFGFKLVSYLYYCFN